MVGLCPFQTVPRPGPGAPTPTPLGASPAKVESRGPNAGHPSARSASPSVCPSSITPTAARRPCGRASPSEPEVINNRQRQKESEAAPALLLSRGQMLTASGKPGPGDPSICCVVGSCWWVLGEGRFPRLSVSADVSAGGTRRGKLAARIVWQQNLGRWKTRGS